MIKNVIEITGNSEKSELDVMTFHDVIRVAMKMLKKIYIYLCLC